MTFDKLKDLVKRQFNYELKLISEDTDAEIFQLEYFNITKERDSSSPYVVEEMITTLATRDEPETTDFVEIGYYKYFERAIESIILELRTREVQQFFANEEMNEFYNQEIPDDLF